MKHEHIFAEFVRCFERAGIEIIEAKCKCGETTQFPALAKEREKLEAVEKAA